MCQMTSAQGWWGCVPASCEMREDLCLGKQLLSSYGVSHFCKEPRLAVWPSIEL